MSCSQVCAIFILHITLTTTCGVEGCSCLCYCHTNQAHDFMCMNEFARVVRQATCIKPGMETCTHVVYVKKAASFLRQDAFSNCY